MKPTLLIFLFCLGINLISSSIFAENITLPNKTFLYLLITPEEIKRGYLSPQCMNEWLYQQFYKKNIELMKNPQQYPPLFQEDINNRDQAGKCAFYLYDFNKQAGVRITNDQISTLHMTDELETVSSDGYTISMVCLKDTKLSPLAPNNAYRGVCVQNGIQQIELNIPEEEYSRFQFQGWLTE
ncbi:MAG TPA: hypothetical protein VGP43_07955 [Chitinophagaceae bacterium]|nr:hypothetical protein [Chitinophagaceae bacterium]